MESLRQDFISATGVSILEIFAPLLRDEERREALIEIRARLTAGLEFYEFSRQEQRWKPSNN